MNFTDIFIRRPVLATVVNLMILALGLRAIGSLPILQYPRTENAVVTVDDDLLRRRSRRHRRLHHHAAGKRHRPGQRHRLHDFDQRQSGVSTITVYLRLNYDADKALTEISTKISSVLNQLPSGSQQPMLSVKVGQTIDAMYMGFDSDVLPRNKITDYLCAWCSRSCRR